MTRDELLSKVRKLLSLSESTNEHEAALAAEKAKKLLDEHNIQEFELTKTMESIIEKEAYTFRKNMKTWIAIVASGLSRYLNCRIVLVNNKLKVIGSKTDIEVFEYLFSCLINTIERLTEKETIPYMTNARSHKDSFRKGMAMGINQKLKLMKLREKQAPATNCTALVLTKEKEVSAFFAKHYPKIRTSRTKANPQSYGYLKGFQAGNDIEINKGIKGSSKNNTLERS